MTKRQHVLAVVISGNLQQLVDVGVVVDGRRTAADPQLPCCEDHVLRRPAQIPYNRQWGALGTRIGRHQCDGQSSSLDVAGKGTSVRQLLQTLSIPHYDEPPALEVLGAAGASAGIQDSVHSVLCYRAIGELPHDADRVDRLPGVHVARVRWRTRCAASKPTQDTRSKRYAKSKSWTETTHLLRPPQSRRRRLSTVLMVEDDSQAFATNLTNFLRANLKPGQNADVAINPELRHVLVFVDGELALTCSFDDLLIAPGAPSN